MGLFMYDGHIKTIFFDLGETLIDTSISCKALNFGLKNVLSDKLVADDELLLKWEKISSKICDQSSKKGEFYTVKKLQIISLENILLEHNINLIEHKIIGIVNEFWRYFIKNCRLYEDVIPVLSRLTQECELGLITNGDEEIVAGILKRHNLNDFFKIKVISSVIKSYKPNRSLFEKALELAKCLPQEAIYVGDSAIDIYGAKKLGFITVIIHRKKTQDIMIKMEPDFSIGSLLQLYPIIKKVSRKS